METKERLRDFTQITGRPWSSAKRLSFFNVLSNSGKVRDSGVIYDRMEQAERIHPNTTIHDYGLVSDPAMAIYPLKFAEVGDFSNGKPVIVLIGGVHGYEPSGVVSLTRAISHNELHQHLDDFNFAVFPLVSPFAFEREHRYNPLGYDVNRTNPLTPEMAALLKALSVIQEKNEIVLILDKHETPYERDKELRLIRASMEGTTRPSEEDINKFVDGFHFMVTQDNDPQVNKQRTDFACAVLSAVKWLTPIASNDFIAGSENNSGIVFGGSKSPVGRNALSKYLNSCGLVLVAEVVPDVLNCSGSFYNSDKSWGLESAANVQAAVMRAAIKEAKVRLRP